MNNAALLILAVLSILGGLLTTFCTLILLMASMPNSSDAQLATIKRWMLAWTILGLASAALAVWSIMSKRMLQASGIGIFPFIAALAALIFTRNFRG